MPGKLYPRTRRTGVPPTHRSVPFDFSCAPRLILQAFRRVEHAIRDPRDLNHLHDIVNPDDTRPAENAGSDGGGRAPEALFGRSRLAVSCECGAEKTLARRTHKQRIAQLRESRKFLEQFVILQKTLAKADAGVEDELRFRNARLACDSHSFAQTLHDVL